LKDVTNETIDCIISNSTLGHLSNPEEILIELKSKLKVGGIIIFSIPHETINFKFKTNDINKIFFAWSPMSLGNLFQNAGFKIVSIKIYKEISFPNETNIQNKTIIKLLNFFRPLYRIFRLILEELGILTLGRDGNIILYSRKIK
jgi:SAM-dependent methyltransferase